MSKTVPASFRDPSGFLFWREGVLYRQINQVYRQHYDLLLSSGLYSQLVGAGLLLSHEEGDFPAADPEKAYRVIRPQFVPFISYPYEWSFSQLQDAALVTLEIQKRAFAVGMILKDSSAYNIQFVNGQPVLIDTLSFESYVEGAPWIAYRQFCQHFLAPLALMAFCDVRLGQLLRVYIDGAPLDLAGKLLPRRTHFNFGLSTHIHLHASAQRRYAGQSVKTSPAARLKMSRSAFLGLLDSLESTVRSLAWRPAGTAWGDYYSHNAAHYSDRALEYKQQVVSRLVQRLSPRTAWDLGANTGLFSRLFSEQGVETVSFDIDPAAVEQNYLALRKEKGQHLLPLVLDLTNPSPALGWAHQERISFLQRGPADVVLALALIHHLAIANNVPLPHLAEFFRQAGHWLVIEFVPKNDSQVQLLLAARQDIFTDYSVQGFEAAFTPYFRIHERFPVPDTERVLYLMEAIG